MKRSELKLQREPGETIFFSCSRAANSVVSDRIWTKFKLFHAFMYVLVTFKNEDDQMKNEGARLVTTLYSYILDAQGQLIVVGGRVRPNIKLIQAFMVVLVTCKNEEDPFKNEGA